MDYSQIDQKIDACFAEEIPRDCDDCPANRDYGGTCCFGVEEEFSLNDPQCTTCAHFYDCKAYIQWLQKNKAEEAEQKERERRMYYNAKRPPIRATRSDGGLVQLKKPSDQGYRPKSSPAAASVPPVQKQVSYQQVQQLERHVGSMLEEFNKRQAALGFGQGVAMLPTTPQFAPVIPQQEAIARALSIQQQDGSLLNRFVKDSVWFGLRGVFAHGVWFFDNYRLP